MIEEYRYITSCIDHALSVAGTDINGLFNRMYMVPDYMMDHSKDHLSQDMCFWKPERAAISAADFDKYEKLTGIALPETYIMFLSYKHFVDLFFAHEASFFKHTRSWIDDNMQRICNWGRDITLDKGLLPFADAYDGGMYCFDSNTIYPGNEYDIVYITAADSETPVPYAMGRFSFIQLIEEMDASLSNWYTEMTSAM